jgi:hypothetical protein
MCATMAGIAAAPVTQLALGSAANPALGSIVPTQVAPTISSMDTINEMVRANAWK